MAPVDFNADVIVVGAGAAGCVVARRCHDAGASVLVLEAGGPDNDERITDATRSYELMDSEHDWQYRTVPQRAIGGRRLAWPRGRVVGGSSSINALVWVRGCAADYDAWAYPGNPGWSYRDLLPLFRRMEDFDRGESEYHGAGGPIPVISEFEGGRVHRAVIDGMTELGVPRNDDHNGEALLGTGWCQYNIRDGRRVSAATAYLDPIRESGRLQVVPLATASRLLFDNGRCSGVEWISDGGTSRARADAEVVLSGGVIGSPQLLMLSGIGPADELAQAGVEPKVDLPGVGRNLMDHVHVPLRYATDGPVEAPAGVPPYQTNTFIATEPGRYTPDVQACSIGFLGEYPGQENAEHGFLVAPTILRTASRGRLRLASPDPTEAPLIDPATFEAPGDVASMVGGIRALRGLAKTQAFKEVGARELSPGPSVGDDDRSLADYARQVVMTAAHPGGTCKMGVDRDAVVDPSLRVYGVDGLRVADASIMPTLVSGNTHAASLVIGERASDLLLKETVK